MCIRDSPRPTRAETTDVANAIYDGTSAIMLSGETAAGAYPIEAVKTMARIARRTEQDINYIKRFSSRDVHEAPNVTNAISHATVTTAHDLGAAAIITVTKSGTTARMISKFRPACPIICCTTNPAAQRQMNLSWGVVPIMADEAVNGPEDALAIARLGAADVLALKIAKSGGIHEMLRTAAVGDAAGMSLYGGTMLEGSVGSIA